MLFDIYQNLNQFLTHNQFASGGILLGIASAAFMYMRTIPSTILNFFLVSVYIKKNDPGYNLIEKWVNDRGKLLTTSFELRSKNEKSTRIEDEDDEEEEDSYGSPTSKVLLKNCSVNCVPGYGTHRIFENGTLFKVYKGKKECENGQILEHISLSFFSLLNKKGKLDTLLKSLQTRYGVKEKTSVDIYYSSSDYSRNWQKFKSIEKGKIQYTVLTEDLWQDLRSDLNRFLNSKEEYNIRGISWNRGYMFYGSPGNGKTSTILKLAKEFLIDVYIIPSSMSFEDLLKYFQKLPEKCFVVFEDVDTLISKRENIKENDEDEDGNPVLSLLNKQMSGKFLGSLLNVLDGLFSVEGRILFITTNHPENLDPALLRPGRIDRKFEFKNASSDQAINMMKIFFPSASTEECIEFGNRIEIEDISMAKMKEMLIRASKPSDLLISPNETTKLEYWRA